MEVLDTGDELATTYLKRRRQEQDQEFLSWMERGVKQHASLTSGKPQREVITDLVTELAPQYGLDPRLVTAVIEAESGFNPRAVSPKGAQGLMQLMPATARRFKVTDPFNIEDNLRGGMEYLSVLGKMFPGEPQKQIAAYNAGEGAVGKYNGIPPYPETQGYVTKVMAAMQAPSGESPAAGPGSTLSEASQADLGEVREFLKAPGQRGTPAVTPLPLPEPPKQTPVVRPPGHELEPGLEEPQWQRLAPNTVKGAVGAAASAIGSLHAFEKFVGIETPFGNTSQDAAMALKNIAQSFDPSGEEENVVDRLAQTAGGQIIFFGAGIGASVSVRAITAAAPKIAAATGLGPAAVSAVVESGAEASDTYEALKGVVGEKEAASRANTVFWKNVIALTVTNRFGVFRESTDALVRVVSGAALEGVQEVVQYDAQRKEFWVPGDHKMASALEGMGWVRQGDRVQMPFSFRDAAEVGILGAIIGGGAGALTTPLATRADTTIPSQSPQDALKTPFAQAMETDTGAPPATPFDAPGAAQAPEVAPVSAPAPQPYAPPSGLEQTQVKDEAGQPMRVFHGTQTTFGAFVPEASDAGGLYGPGFYFTENPEVASSYAEGKGTSLDAQAGAFRRWEASLEPLRQQITAAKEQRAMAQKYPGWERELAQAERTLARLEADVKQLEQQGETLLRYGQHVRPVYLDIRHPLDMAAPPEASILEAARAEVGGVPDVATNEEFYDWLVEEMGDKGDVNAWLHEHGYDGITHLGGGRLGRGQESHQVWIAFDPSQVKPVFGAPEGAETPFAQPRRPSWFEAAMSTLGGERGSVTPESFLPQQPSPPPASKVPTLRQGAEGLDVSRFRDAHGRWTIPLKDIPPQELELQDFIRQQGGIQLASETDVPGELRALITRKETGIGGLQNNISGRTLQHMAERAQEAGFIATADKVALLEAMDRSINQNIETYSVHATGNVPLLNDPILSTLYKEVVDLADTFSGRVTEQRRGARPRVPVHEEARQMIEQGEFTLQDVREILPGTALNDTMASALVQTMTRMGAEVKNAAQRYLDAGAQTGSAEERGLLGAISLFSQLDPVRLGVIAEQGRGLGILNDPLSSYNQFLKRLDATLAGMPNETTAKLAQRLVALKTTPQLAKTLSDIAKPGFADMFLEAWINGMLFNPGTINAAFLSNAYMAAYAVPERFVAGVWGRGRPGHVAPGEAEALAWGMVHGIREGWVLAGRALRTGQEQFSGTHEVHQRPKALTAENVGFNPNTALGKAFDFWAEFIGFASGGRLGSRLMMSMDELFKAVNYRGQLAALAYREAYWKGLGRQATIEHMRQATTHPSAEQMRQAAEGFAVTQVFQDELREGSLGERLQRFSEWRLHPPGMDIPIGKILVPFIRTPANVARAATERTPLGWLYREMRDDLKAGGARQDMAVAKMVLGSMAMTAFAGLAASGLITGRGPEDRAAREALRRENWRPYSLKIGGVYVEYNRIDPVGAQMGMVADIVQLAGEADMGTLETVASAALLIPLRNILSKNYMKGLAEAFQVLSPSAFADGQKFGGDMKRWLEQRAASLVPSAVATAEQAKDPVEREVDGMLAAIYARIPGWSEGLPARRNVWGNKQIRGWGFSPEYLSATLNAVTPMRLSEYKESALEQELAANNVVISLPPKQLTTNAPGEGSRAVDALDAARQSLDDLELTDAQHEKYILFAAANRDELAELGLSYPPQHLRQLTQAVGKLGGQRPPSQMMSLEESLSWLVTTRGYLRESEGEDGGRSILMRQVVRQYRDAGKQLLLDEEPDLKERYNGAIAARELARVRPEKRSAIERKVRRDLEVGYR